MKFCFKIEVKLADSQRPSHKWKVGEKNINKKNDKQ